MTFSSDDTIRKVTSQLKEEILQEQLYAAPDIVYRPVPHANAPVHPTWRVRLEAIYDSHHCIGLDINGEVVLGRGQDTPEFVTIFNAEDAEHLGVSRRHAMLRPSDSKLYILDLGSTNGTWLNGRSIGVNMPYSLSNGDIVRLGHLELTVRIVKQPNHIPAANHNTKHDLGDILPVIARAISPQLDLKDVLRQAIEMALTFTPADEVTVWLVDEQTGELFLEAGQGMNEGQISRLPVNDTLAGKVIREGKPLRVNRSQQGEQVKLKTGYLVAGVIYVPLTLGGVTFGVLSAVHREENKSFSGHDEKVMTAIADLAAIAVQNARVHEATQHRLNHYTKVVTAFNYALSYDLKNHINSVIGYTDLLRTSEADSNDMADITQHMFEAGSRMAYLVGQLCEITNLSQELHFATCDLFEVIVRAIEDLQDAAAQKTIGVDFQMMGEPYFIQGDSSHLYRSVFNLLDNAIRYSPTGAQVWLALIFGHHEIIVRVRDTGPGIPEDILPHLFESYVFKPSADGQPGIGLGLEVVRATAEAHRGRVYARNAEDQGAEFVITLPSNLRVK